MPRKIQHGIVSLVVLLVCLAGLVITVTHSRTLAAGIALSTVLILVVAYFLKRFLPDANTVGTLLVPESGTTFAQQAPVGKNGEVLISYASYTILHRRFIASLLFTFLLGGGLLIGFRTIPVPTAALFIPVLIAFFGVGIYALYSLLQLAPSGTRFTTLKSLVLSDPRQAFARYAPKENSGALKVGYTTYKRIYKFGLWAFSVFILLLIIGLTREITIAQSSASQNFRAALEQLKVVITTLTTGQGDLWYEVKRLASQSLQPAPTIDEDSLTQKIVAQITKNLPAPTTEIVRQAPTTEIVERSTVQENKLKTIELQGNGKFVIKNSSSNIFVTFGEGSAITFEEGSIFNIKGLWQIGGTTITTTAAQLNGLDTAPFVMLAADPNINGERVLQAGDGLLITDYGVNKNVVISLDELGVGVTDTDATAGSLFFAGTNGVLQQDNNALFWNNSDNRLGIGTTSPSATLDVRGKGVFGDSYVATTFGNSNLIQIHSKTNNDKIGYELYNFEGHNNRRAEFFLDDANGLFGLDGYQSTVATDFVLRTQSIERLRVKGVGGMVGIGTSSPVGTLTIANSSLDELYFSGTGTASIYQAVSAGALYINSNTGAISIGANGSASAHLTVISSGNVGIGITSPGFLFDVQGTSTSLAAFTAYIDSDSASTLVLRKARGTQATPTNVLTDDKLGSFGARGYVQSSGFQSNSSARIQMSAAENYTSTSNLGSYITFDTTPIASGTIREVVRIDSTGSVGIGVTSFGTSGTNVLALGNGTAPASSISNGIQLYAEDVAASSELKVRDEAGNVTTLSPHNFSLFDPNDKNYNGIAVPWSFYSRNEDKGQEINVDMLGALQAIEQLSGQQFVYVKNLATGSVIQPKLTSSIAPLTLDDIAPYIALLEKLSDQVQALSADLKKLQAEFNTTSTAPTALTLDTATLDSSEKALVIDVITIQKSITVHGDSVIFGSLTVAKNASVQGELSLSGRQTGLATILKGSKQVNVTYSTPMKNAPLVQVTPYGAVASYWVSDSTKSGFTIQLADTATQNITFAWIAITSSNPTSIQGAGAPEESPEKEIKEPEADLKTEQEQPQASLEPVLSPVPSAEPSVSPTPEVTPVAVETP